MNDNHQAVFDFILKYKQAHDGISPTVREIMEATEYNSTSAVMAALEALRDQGLIKMPIEKRTRQIQVVGGVWLPPQRVARIVNYIEDDDLAGTVDFMLNNWAYVIPEGS